MSVLDLMTPEQRERSKESMAMTQCQLVRFPMGDHPQRLTGHFHQVVNLPVETAPIVPSVTTRERRLRLLLEEFLEVVEAMGFEMTVGGHSDFAHSELGVKHVEGSRYCVVETADGLSDINVIVAGTAVEFGIPLHVTDYEVYSSNLTKVLPDGTTIVNGVTPGYRGGEEWLEHADANEEGFQEDRPVGKILKPDNFVPANIPAALVAFERQEF
jgi:predicted HAD superfamily Cof-like phosphohydrolase